MYHSLDHTTALLLCTMGLISAADWFNGAARFTFVLLIVACCWRVAVSQSDGAYNVYSIIMWCNGYDCGIDILIVVIGLDFQLFV